MASAFLGEFPSVEIQASGLNASLGIPRLKLEIDPSKIWLSLLRESIE